MITIQWLIHPLDILNDLDLSMSKIDGNSLFSQILEEMIKSDNDESKYLILRMNQLSFRPGSPMDVLKTLSYRSNSPLRFVFDSPYGNVILFTDTYKNIDPLIVHNDKLSHFHCIEVLKHENNTMKLIAEDIPFKELSRILLHDFELTNTNI